MKSISNICLPGYAHNLVVILLAMMLMVSMTSCAAVQMPSNYAAPLGGQVLQLEGSSVIYGIQQCLRGTAGTGILMNGDKVIFLWSYAGWNATAFFGIDLAKMTIMDVGPILATSGNLANSKDVGMLVKALSAAGYTSVTASQLPQTFVSTALNFSNRASLLVIPAATVEMMTDLDKWARESMDMPEPIDL